MIQPNSCRTVLILVILWIPSCRGSMQPSGATIHHVTAPVGMIGATMHPPPRHLTLGHWDSSRRGLAEPVAAAEPSVEEDSVDLHGEAFVLILCLYDLFGEEPACACSTEAASKLWFIDRRPDQPSSQPACSSVPFPMGSIENMRWDCSKQFSTFRNLSVAIASLPPSALSYSPSLPATSDCPIDRLSSRSPP